MSQAHVAPLEKEYPSIPYVAPFLLFLALLAVAPYLGFLGRWEAVTRVLILSGALWVFSRHVVDWKPANWLASVGLGLAVFALWIGPDTLFPGYRQHWLFTNAITGSAKTSIDASLLADPLVLVFRSLRAIVLVAVIEELFWRAFLMRWLIRPDFKSVSLGTYSAQAFWITAALFAAEHGSYWEVGLATGAIYNWWMVRTKSLGDLILTHAVTNAALCGYVILTGKWEYWL